MVCACVFLCCELQLAAYRPNSFRVRTLHLATNVAWHGIAHCVICALE